MIFFPYFFKNVDKFIDAGFIGFLVGKGLANGTDYTLPDEGVGENGWFFNQLIEFDKGRPYYTKSDELEPQIPGDTPNLIKTSAKKTGLLNISVVGKTLSISFAENSSAIVSIFDVSGKRLLRTSINKNAQIPLTRINAGIYFVKTELSGKEFTEKIILK